MTAIIKYLVMLLELEERTSSGLQDQGEIRGFLIFGLLASEGKYIYKDWIRN